MIEKNITIVNKLGLHARAAAKLVHTASGHASEVLIRKNGQEVNGKSIMGVMMLAAEQGAQVAVRAEGEDADAAIEAMISLLESTFEGQT